MPAINSSSPAPGTSASNDPSIDSAVAIIILNRNQTVYTRDCLASLRAIDYPNYRIVVIDNGSTDDSLLQMASEFPEVEFLWLKENLGVAGGRNAGLRHMLALHPEYVLLLDNDTLIAPDCLTKLVARLSSDPAIGGVQPKIYFVEPPGRICSVGGKFYPRISHSRHPGSGQDDCARFQQAAEIDTVLGCAGLMRARVFQEVGLFDETYFPYGPEDVELSLRLRDAGYRLMLEPAATVWHRVSSRPQSDPAKIENNAKALVLFVRFRTRFWDVPLSTAWIVFYLIRRFFLPLLLRREWRSIARVFRGLWHGLTQDRRPVEKIAQSGPSRSTSAQEVSEFRYELFVVGKKN